MEIVFAYIRLFHEMGKSVAYFTKWTKFLPISRNEQFRGLGIRYIHLKCSDV